MKILGFIPLEHLDIQHGLTVSVPLVNDIKKYGQRVPIEIAGNQIIDGHKRASILQDNGKVYIAAYDLAENPSDEFIPLHDVFDPVTVLVNSLNRKQIWIKTPESSNIKEYAYENLVQILSVRFNDDSEYHYMGVRQETADKFMNSPSLGVGLNHFIKGKHDYVSM